MKKLAFLMALVAFPAWGAPFLVSDPVPAVQGAYTISHCAYTRAGTTTLSPVESVTGGVRCKIDLASDSKIGTVSVAYRDDVLGVVSDATNFTFGAVPAPAGLRLIP